MRGEEAVSAVIEALGAVCKHHHQKDYPPRFRFVDLFAGIGGFRLAGEALDGVCVDTVEKDDFAAKVYRSNFPEDCWRATWARDILEMTPNQVEPHDALFAGFPCQPYSTAGKRKGMDDPRGGDVFHAMCRVIDYHKPALFVLENVPGLISPKGLPDFQRMVDELGGLGYNMHWRIINANAWLPQNRKRLFVVGSLWSKKPVPILDLLDAQECKLSLVDIMDLETDDRLYLSKTTWKCLLKHKEKQKRAGRGFGFQEFYPHEKANTISARYGKDGSECLLRDDAERVEPRRLSVREIARLMGFPEDFSFGQVSRTQAYRLLGNAVCPPVAKAVLGRCMPYLDNYLRGTP